MPVLYLGRNGNHYTRLQFYSLLAPFLIPATTADADKHLHSLVVDVPVVTATWLEGDVVYTATHIGQITVADKVLIPTGETVVDLNQGKDTPIRVLRLQLYE